MTWYGIVNNSMEIFYVNRKIEKICTDDKFAQKALGKGGALVLRERLKQMRSAVCLEDLRLQPGGWHELKGDRKGELSCSLLGLKRLVFMPADDPCPIKPDGGLDWSKVTAVINLEIVDYH